MHLMMDASWFWFLVGIVLIVAGLWLMADFLIDFAKLIVGLIFLVIGLQFLGFGRRGKVRVR